MDGSPAERRWATTGVVGPKQDTGWRYGGKTWDALKQPIAVQLCLRPANGERGGGTGLQRGECSPQIVKLLVIWENMISALSTLTIEQQNLHFVNTQIVYLDFSK